MNGNPVAVSPAPPRPTAIRAPSPRRPDLRRQPGLRAPLLEPHLDGSPYNISGTATYDSSKAAEPPDPPPDPSFGPQGDVRYFQGDVATHGLHLLFTSDSDNAYATVPVDEIDSLDTQLILPPDQPNIGSAPPSPC